MTHTAFGGHMIWILALFQTILRSTSTIKHIVDCKM